MTKIDSALEEKTLESFSVGYDKIMKAAYDQEKKAQNILDMQNNAKEVGKKIRRKDSDAPMQIDVAQSKLSKVWGMIDGLPSIVAVYYAKVSCCP